MKGNNTSFLLRYAARRAANNPFFLAESLIEFSRVHAMEEEELAGFLGCSVGLLSKLALCRRPDSESPRFRSDVERIAIAFNMQPVRLAQLIREIDIIKALAKASLTNQVVPDGLLAAARDDEDKQSGDMDTDKSRRDKEEKP